MTTQASATALQVYQYKLNRERRELEKLQQKLDERRMILANAEVTYVHTRGTQEISTEATAEEHDFG
jgi:hypothetical protein